MAAEDIPRIIGGKDFWNNLNEVVRYNEEDHQPRTWLILLGWMDAVHTKGNQAPALGPQVRATLQNESAIRECYQTTVDHKMSVDSPQVRDSLRDPAPAPTQKFVRANECCWAHQGQCSGAEKRIQGCIPMADNRRGREPPPPWTQNS